MQKSLITSAGLVLAAGFLVLFIGGGARFAIGLTLRPIVADLGWGRTELGGAVALFQLVSALAMFAAGRLVDTASPRLVLGTGLAISGLGIGTMSAMAAPWHALVLYGIVYAVGNGAASLIPVGVMVTRAFPQRTGTANAVAVSGMSLGQLLMIAALAAVLVSASWRTTYLWLGLAHLVLVPLVIAMIPRLDRAEVKTARPASGLGLRAAARTRRFWLLIVVYAICGFDDFFVSTHVVAFAQDRGVDAFLAGNLLALMGLTGLLGVVAAGLWSDRAGPVWPAAASFAIRLAVFALVLLDQSPASVAAFALVFGFTFLMTAPLAVVFVAKNFGARHLGALTGLITMVHHVCGGLGAFLGAAVFDATGGYDLAWAVMLGLTVAAFVLCLLLGTQRTPATA